ncbi:unnamed protein product [Closterium sp. NIES-64]|nr:unnamed protein product [Closterium sp. NIES-64]
MWWPSDIKAPAASNGAQSRPSRAPQHPWAEDLVSRADDDAVTDAAVRGWASAAADWDARSGDEGRITGRGGAWVWGGEPSARRWPLTGKGGDAQGKGGRAGERGGAESGQSREEGELGRVVRAGKRAGGENGGEGGGASQQGARRGGGADLEARIRRACEWVGVLPGGAPQIEGGTGRAAAIAGGSVGSSGVTETLGSSLQGQDSPSGRSDSVCASFQLSDAQRVGRPVANHLPASSAASGAANRAWEAGYELELLTAAWGEHLPVLLLDASAPSTFPARPCADNSPPPSARQHQALRHATGEARVGRREKSGAASGHLAEERGGDQQRGRGKRAAGSSGAAIGGSTAGDAGLTAMGRGENGRVIKTVLQAHRGSGAPSGVLSAVGRVVAEKGPLGLYSGVAASLATAAPISAIYACTYEAVKEALLPLVPQRLAPVAHSVAGAAASVATSAVFTPSEAVKQRMQTTTHFRSSLHALVGMARTEGVASLYGGLAAVLARNIPNSVIKFLTYEALKKRALEAQVKAAGGADGPHATLLSPANQLLVGGAAGSTAAFCTTPFDVVKTRLQTHLPGAPKYKGVVDAFSRIAREEGIGALYR